MEIMHTSSSIMLIILWIHVRINLDLAHQVWQNKCSTITQEVDGLGTQFHSAIRAGWLKYLKDTYAARQEEGAICPSIGQGRW